MRGRARRAALSGLYVGAEKISPGGSCRSFRQDHVSVELYMIAKPYPRRPTRHERLDMVKRAQILRAA